ncbi:MAG: rhomboid family intramembrane serine protease [Saprospiraceae bacterium]|nr:rhomboid family intramembrane serine protease [Saprospiraceae bacterium]
MVPLTDVVKNLLIINVLVYVSLNFLLTTFPLQPYFQLYPFDSGHFQPYQIVTSMFNHDSHGIGHLLFNMMALYFIGPIVEHTLGPKKFLFLYLSSGILSGVFHLLFAHGIAVGASGAIYGILISLAFMYPNLKMMVFPIPFEIRAIVLAGLFVAYDLFSGVSQASSGVAHFAHLGGAVMGGFLTWYWGMSNLRK